MSSYISLYDSASLELTILANDFGNGKPCDLREPVLHGKARRGNP